jgi:hypothetical protein
MSLQERTVFLIKRETILRREKEKGKQDTVEIQATIHAEMEL